MNLKSAGPACAALVALWLAGNAASGREIFVPTPRGDNASLDSPEPGKPDDGLDMLHFGKSSLIAGKLLAISPDGLVSMNSPDLKGNLEVLVASARTLTFAKKPEAAKDARYDRVLLTNEDLLCGEVLAITPEAVTFREAALGTVSIARRVVKSIAFRSGSVAVFESNFANGAKGWISRQGNWVTRDGKYWSFPGTSFAFTDLDQQGPITCEWAMECPQQYPSAGVALVASSNNDYWGRDSLTLQITGNVIRCYAVSNGEPREIGQIVRNNMIGGAEFRLSYDPGSGAVHFWMNNEKLGDWVAAGAPKTGKYLMLLSQQPTGFRYVRVARGLGVPAQSGGDADPQGDRILLGNKDRVTGDVLSLDQGKLSVKTAYGAMDIALDSMGEIVFGKARQEVPRRRPRDIQVEFNNSRLTMEISQLGQTSLEGKTEFAGTMAVRREAVKSIRFNLYQ